MRVLRVSPQRPVSPSFFVCPSGKMPAPFPSESFDEPARDPRKPAFPYNSGLNLTIRRHIPPQPFGACGYERDARPRNLIKSKEIQGLTHSEFCLRYPPTETRPHPDTSTRTIRIIDQLACRDGRGVQVVRCSLEGGNRIYVAKIYDPLYYTFGCEGWAKRSDVTLLADEDYSREASGYEELRKAGVDGSLVPTYYGSWTFEASLLNTRITRQVRLILVEFIKGESLMSLYRSSLPSSAPKRLNSEQRLRILARAMEVYSKVHFCQVSHGDFAPRNAVLRGPDLENPDIVLIDLNSCTVHTRPKSVYRPVEARRPLNPAYLFWSELPEGFEYWFPEPHFSKPAVYKGWLRSQSRWYDPAKFEQPTKENRESENFDEPVEYSDPISDEENRLKCQ
ncbi:hypothetical protein B0I35DRAFT_427465 [Stachybotrys elegans]|uniref:Protein kinase domain-containing protein n=1 Tax=Stachybotrys elegans TaxID=80388 RepID=A0A8K0SUW8_9HYPO|nr:hypothetical protein B0I35DRAFT_427465 [Stachybotrys elegans]